MVSILCERCDIYSSNNSNDTHCLICGIGGVVQTSIENNLYEIKLRDGGSVFFEKQPRPICRLLDAPDVGNKIEEIRGEVIKLRKWGNVWKKIALSRAVPYLLQYSQPDNSVPLSLFGLL